MRCGLCKILLIGLNDYLINQFVLAMDLILLMLIGKLFKKHIKYYTAQNMPVTIHQNTIILTNS